MGRLKRKRTSKMTGKQKMKQRNVTLKFITITEMKRNMNKIRRTLKLKKRKMENQKITKRKKLKRIKRL